MGELRSDNTTYVYNPTDRGTISAEFVKDFWMMRITVFLIINM